MTNVVYVVAFPGLNTASLTDDIGPSVQRSAIRAVNKTLGRTRTRADRGIRDQVAFTASYLAPSAGRLVVDKKARASDISGTVTGRARPTSLARFTNAKLRGRGQGANGGVKVKVKPTGVARFLSGAFVIPLRSGQDGSLGNTGLAIRSDEKPKGAYKPKKLGRDLWLLYGPSVSQVLYSPRNTGRGGGVAEQIAPEAVDFLEAEFLRLLDVENIK